MNISKPFFLFLLLCCLPAWTLAMVESDSTFISSKSEHKTALTELTDREYPNNPDKKYRSRVYTKVDYTEVVFSPTGGMKFDVEFQPQDSKYPTITLDNINLAEYIPTVPTHVRDDEYLSLVSVVNQEWNRNQITFRNNHFTVEPGKKAHKHRISRVDVARSCLNSYLWEAFFYTYNPVWRKHELMYHGWFKFPKELYQEMFKERNGVDFSKYAEHLEEWKDLPAEKVNFDLLREVISEKNVAFEELNDEMYPIEGERKKKEDEVLFPRRARRMSDFHTNKAKFSSFVEPGMYVKKEKRLTELSRFQQLNKAVVRQTKNSDTYSNNHLTEVELSFTNDQGQTTILTIGGIDLDDTAIVVDEKANDADLYSMGIGNHTFYEKYSEQQSYSSQTNPYYGLLTNEKGEFLDSHFVGIDGPLIHKDSKRQNILHVWLLSYERHALVGHYTIKLD